MTAPPDPAAELLTIRDTVRYAVSRFRAAHLVYGHGTATAIDEAAFMVLEALHLPIDELAPWLDARLTRPERERLLALIEARVTTRKPAAYLLGRAYIQGIPFHVDERVIVPRSFIGELLFRDDLIGASGSLVDDADAVTAVLDLCTGSGALAILAAHVFPNARIDAVDISADALRVAERNVAECGHADRIALHRGDLFAPLEGRRYDLVLTNPPYVDAEGMASLPPEFRHEPTLALAAGGDGLDIVRRILADGPVHLADDGGLLCEIGRGRAPLEAAFAHLPFLWLDTEASEGEVFWLTAPDFAGPARSTPAKARRRSAVGPKPSRRTP